MSPVRIATRADCLSIAKVAEQAERWDDVISQLKSIITYSDARLSTEERNLLSIAYKNATSTLRNSWRTIETLEKQETDNGRATRREQVLLRREREKIEQELANVCQDLLKLLQTHLVPAADPGEEKVFYCKMQGDYYRYVTEFARKQNHEHYAQLSLEAYKAAYKHSLSTLEPWHPTRLGLALNFAVYYRDVRASPERACHLAKHAFDEAVAMLNDMPEQAFKDSVMILQLLRDDLILWSAEMQHEPGDVKADLLKHK
ncbi:14-3-3 protein [Artomyces pyxidatus]|uniref:14-3-3 protein n=1 Tax=Artomyces pyxidatus TaxID=48021 RepID=A0ACB8T1Y9_9AGAM|nr:14-3-3 protein [Artomyces pyxidatus]